MSSAVNKSPQHWDTKFLGTLRIKPWAAGWEDRTLPLCYAHLKLLTASFRCSAGLTGGSGWPWRTSGGWRTRPRPSWRSSERPERSEERSPSKEIHFRRFPHFRFRFCFRSSDRKTRFHRFMNFDFERKNSSMKFIYFLKKSFRFRPKLNPRLMRRDLNLLCV